jgi:hypothetical protein
VLDAGSATSSAFSAYVNWMSTIALLFSSPGTSPGDFKQIMRSRAGITRKDAR